MIFALFSALSNIVATTINKFLLSRDKMPILSFSIWLFIFLAGLTAITLPWIGWVDFEKLISMPYIFYFVVMIGLAAVWNYFYYTCLEKESLSDFQLIAVIQPLLTIFLSMLVFADERGYKIMIATVVAGVVLIASHLNRWKIDNPILTIPLLVAVLLSAIENLYLKEMLDITSPATLYFLRTFFVAIIFLGVSPAALRLSQPKHLYKTIIVAFFAVLTMILSFYGYQTIGVAKTNIIFLLYPIGTTILSVYLLKERIKKRKLIAFIVIVLCIIYVFVNGS